MIVTKSISPVVIVVWTWFHIFWLFIFSSSIACLYYYNILNVELPWLPISVIGTAVAFYVGFKNNSAYARMWEARKIWGAIVNSSRAWGSFVDSYVSSQFLDSKLSEEKIHEIKKRLIYRHIGWLYSLRRQLLVVVPWEHASQKGYTGYRARYYQKKFGVGMFDDKLSELDLKLYLPEGEYARLSKAKNPATQIINEQARDLAGLREENIIDDFRHVEMMNLLNNFYDHQGGCERIKKFPLPRQYASISRYFVGIFIALLPFSMIPEIMKVGEWGVYLSVFVTMLIGWVYVTMEIVGDYSVNPFQGMAYDVPMLSLSRTVEIDLREMLNEPNLPEPIEIIEGVLM